MASRRLNERLAKYNYLYDDEDETKTTSAEPKLERNGSDESMEKLTNGGSVTINNNISAKDTSAGEPQRVNVRKFSQSVSVSSTASSASGSVPNSPTSYTPKASGVAPRGPLLSTTSITASPRINISNHVSTSNTPQRESIAARNISKREQFFKNEAPATKYEAPSTKFDPSNRERDGKAEKAGTPKENGHGRLPGSRNDSSKNLEGYVGFANLPNQVYRKSVKRGFEFTLMVVGESGMGKSTLINSLFLSELYGRDYPGPSQRLKKTVQMNSTQVLLKEGGVQLKLNVVDTPGFGDAVDNSDCWQPVTSFIDQKFDEYLNSESKVNRKSTPDNRVHCCLYFIAPTGHSLKPLDIEFMKRLHDKVNIIPLIAKADTLTPEECRDFKKTILNEIEKNKIRIYEFPDVEDEDENATLRKLKDRVPYAVVGSNKVMEVNGKKVRGRQYPWGLVEVDNLLHNDFLALRDMLIRTHMQDLRDVTNNVHYENFRYKKLANVSVTDGKVKDGSKDPLSQMNDERKEHNQKMKKMEAEMEQVFEMKVKEKMQKLKDSETDLSKRAEQMKKSLEAQEADLEQKRREFMAEKSQWESMNRPEETLKKGKKSLF